MVDRTIRNIVLDAIEKYMQGKITDSEFNLVMMEPVLIDGTDDETVVWLDSMFLPYIGSPEGKTFPHHRTTWEFFNRARLLMASDAEIVVIQKRRWNVWQGVALAAVLAFYPLFWHVIVLCGKETWLEHVYFYTIVLLCGGITCLLQKQRQKIMQPNIPEEKYKETWPFPSHEELLEVKQNIPEFEGWKYPFTDDVLPDKPRSSWKIASSVLVLPIFIFAAIVIVLFYCLLSPIILLGELWPVQEISLQVDLY